MIVSVVAGLAGALLSLGMDLNLKQGIILTLVCIGREVDRYLKDHPVSTIGDLDTNPSQFVQTTVKTTVDTKTSDHPISNKEEGNL